MFRLECRGRIRISRADDNLNKFCQIIQIFRHNMKTRFFFFNLPCFYSPLFLSAQQLQPDAEGSLVKWITVPEAMEKIKTQPGQYFGFLYWLVRVV